MDEPKKLKADCFDQWTLLPAIQKKIGVLRFVEGLSILKTAQAVKMKQKDVRRRQGLLYRKMRARQFYPWLDNQADAARIVEHIEDVIFREELNSTRPTKRKEESEE